MAHRFKLTIEYDGTGLVGWQRQDEGASVQGLIEKAILQFCSEELTVTAAGRTDAGVHALGQVAHVDLAKDWTEYQVMHAINFHLVDTRVSILKAEKVSDEFHARFSAKGRRYLYKIANRSARLALDQNRAWHVAPKLDAKAMQEAAKHLIGHHDFTTFRDSECQAASPMKTLDELRVEKISESEIHIHAAAKSFLHHQVRNMVGSLTMVGKGKWSVDDFIKARDAKDRRAGGPTAAAEGLYFVEVSYE